MGVENLGEEFGSAVNQPTMEAGMKERGALGGSL